MNHIDIDIIAGNEGIEIDPASGVKFSRDERISSYMDQLGKYQFVFDSLALTQHEMAQHMSLTVYAGNYISCNTPFDRILIEHGCAAPTDFDVDLDDDDAYDDDDEADASNAKERGLTRRRRQRNKFDIAGAYEKQQAVRTWASTSTARGEFDLLSLVESDEDEDDEGELESSEASEKRKKKKKKKNRGSEGLRRLSYSFAMMDAYLKSLRDGQTSPIVAASGWRSVFGAAARSSNDAEAKAIRKRLLEERNLRAADKVEFVS